MYPYEVAFYTALFFLSGVGLAGLKINGWFVLGLVSAAALLFFFWGLIKKKKRLKILAVLAVFVFIGFFYFHFRGVLDSPKIIYGKTTTFEGVVDKAPAYSLTGQTLNLRLEPPLRGETTLYLPSFPRYRYGDRLQAEGLIKKSANGLTNFSSPNSVKLLSEGNGSKLKAYLFSIKDGLEKSLSAALPVEKEALASGLLFGEKADFSPDFKTALANSGLTHLVALSGYNISVVALAVSYLITLVWNRRKAFFVSLIFIVLFVLMTGAEASVVRAGIMGIMALVAENQSRFMSFRNAIALTAVTMVLIDPTLLVFNLGFELSFAALLGLVYLEPVLKRLARPFSPKVEEAGWLGWRKNFFQTTAAQLAVAPLILNAFHRFSPLSLLANLLVLELIPVTMFFSFLTAMAGMVSFDLASVLGWFDGLFLGYEISIVNLFGAFSL